MKNEKTTYIYLLVGYIDGEIRYKIGLSNDVKRRLSELRTANPSIKLVMKVEILHKFSFKIEKSFHNKYKYNNVGGEWFSLTKENIDKFKNDCEQVQESLIYLAESGNPYIK
jgi:hypothetical protein